MIIEEKLIFLENYLDKLCKDDVFPGATFAILDANNSYINYVGKSQLVPKEEDVNLDTIYDLASLTKIIATTTSIMMLIERGYFTLDTYVEDILPRYKNPRIKIKHLLTHISGHDADIDCSKMNKRELIDAVYNSNIDPNRFEKEVVYSDIGYIILGFVIEEVTGSFERFVQENILKPLNMNTTFFNPSEEYTELCAPTEFCTMRSKIVKGIVHDEKCYILGGVSGHAGLFSTINDISNFIRMYLDGGLFNGKVILNKQTIKSIIKCYTSGTDSERGLGWILKSENNVISDFASNSTIYHTGFTGTSIVIDIDNKKGFALLSNRIHPSRENKKIINFRRNIHNIALTAIE